jgi:hypothetical protein
VYYPTPERTIDKKKKKKKRRMRRRMRGRKKICLVSLPKHHDSSTFPPKLSLNSASPFSSRVPIREDYSQFQTPRFKTSFSCFQSEYFSPRPTFTHISVTLFSQPHTRTTLA